MDAKITSLIKMLQVGEITEYSVYIRIAKYIKDKTNRDTLLKIAEEEKKHYNIWKKYTNVDLKPSKLKVFFFTFLARVFGYTFSIKQMERSLNKVHSTYQSDNEINKYVPEIKTIEQEEFVHENKLINLIDEEKLHYVGSMVLGLNDALVEFTGALAGYSFSMQNNKLISLAGLITGISATLSMAASEFLSSRSDGEEDSAKSAAYTGVAYLITVALLIAPYLLLPSNMYGAALVIMLLVALVIIAAFNYYISVAKDLSFKKRFIEMSGISLSVAAISFIIGLLVKKFLGIEV
ncbi:VIT1/CCC1 transporter family protein [Clostridium sp. 19966]|uniref:VIT1/CCC1 transporter family protein n=1 Tax=Clostridium sp. 19966 TaxID=2768166 RepID=UPI0028EBEF93|nr:VIT1/CCC1 transporter family protein [Clostridium sp. 19966]